MTFARFLSAQKAREDWIGDLARAAAKDTRFPWSAAPMDQREHVRRHMGGDAEALHAFDAALDEWHGGPYPMHLDVSRREEERRARSHAAFVAADKAEAERKRLARNARAKERRSRPNVSGTRT